VALVWVGSPEQRVPDGAAGGLWNALMQYASQGLPATGWEMPPGVTVVEVCDPSGMLPGNACQNVVREPFISGNDPTQVDTLFQIFEVNRETELLATVFTPPDLIERRVYMIVPGEAQAWAQSAGMESPPTLYDSIQVLPPDPDVHITSPESFTEVKGKVRINGTASGEGFAYYRLEYGQGLNPQAWFLIGEYAGGPVVEKLLGEWDVSDLDGLYALRLMVVRTDGRVDRAAGVVVVR
jgi:hypothetical protein